MLNWIGFVVLFAGAVGAAAMGVQSGSPLMEMRPESLAVPAVSMRPLPGASGAVAKAAPETAKAVVIAEAPVAPEKAEDDPPALPAAVEPAKPEPVKVGPNGAKNVAARPIEAPPALPPAAPKPAAAKTPHPAPEGEVAAAGGGGDGTINLKASDTAEVVVDGRKVGPSPRLGMKLKPGKHKIRFDCYDAEGNLKAGKVQTVDIAAESEQDIDYDCPPIE